MTERRIPHSRGWLQSVEYSGEYQPIYVGEITEQDLASGEAQRKLEIAERARLIVALEGHKGPLISRIDTLTKKIDPSPLADERLTTDEKNSIAKIIASLVNTYDQQHMVS